MSDSIETIAAVELEGVTIAYNGVSVLDDVNLTVNQGEFIGILGRSGSGKTSLLNCINGLVPAEGRIRVCGSVRTVFQEDRLFPWYRVKENIASGAIGFPKLATDSDHALTTKEQIAEKLLEELGMERFRNRFPHELSGGERQRVNIARAFASQPSVVCMDEPFGSLDALTRREMGHWLMEFWSLHQATILFVTHDVSEALMLADRVAIVGNRSLSTPTLAKFPRPREASLSASSEFAAARLKLLMKLGAA